MKEKINVAGVTFTNTNGTIRQNILKSMSATFQTARLKTVDFVNDKGQTEKAIEVYISGYQVGYIPKNQLNNPLAEQTELTAFIAYCKGKYYCELTARQVPSAKEYAYMKHICIKSKKTMPAYDTRAYALAWATVKA